MNDAPTGLAAERTRRKFDFVGTVEASTERYDVTQTASSLVHGLVGDDRMPKVFNRADLVTRYADGPGTCKRGDHIALHLRQIDLGTRPEGNVTEFRSNRAIRLVGRNCDRGSNRTAPLLAVLIGLACGPVELALAQEPGSSQLPRSALPFGDPQALSVGVPVRIQDALAPPAGDLIFQTLSTNTDVDRHNGFTSPLSETVKLGVVDGFSLNVATTHTFPAENAGVTVNPSFQYVFFNNQNFDNGLPILSVEGSYLLPPGTGFSGGEYGFSAQLTQVIGVGERAPRLHLNLEYEKINDGTGRSRPETFGFGGGVSNLLNERTAIVCDVFYAQMATRDDSQMFGDLGLNYLVDKHIAIGAGGGLGADRGQFAARAFLSVSTAFKLFE